MPTFFKFATPRPPGFRVVLWQTEASGQTLIGRSVCDLTSCDFFRVKLSIQTDVGGYFLAFCQGHSTLYYIRMHAYYY